MIISSYFLERVYTRAPAFLDIKVFSFTDSLKRLTIFTKV